MIATELIAARAEIEALRAVLGEAQKAMRPFEWVSQYVDNRLVGVPMTREFKDALGRLTIGDFNILVRAVTKVDDALAQPAEGGGIK